MLRRLIKIDAATHKMLARLADAATRAEGARVTMGAVVARLVRAAAQRKEQQR